MSTFIRVSKVSACLIGWWLTAGCRTDAYVGSPYHVGPAAGTAVGYGAGVVAGNAVGFGAGVAQGAVAGTAAALDPSYHMVRQWRTETTSDGRTIQEPYDIMVDQFGRPVIPPPPTGNPPPPPAPPGSTPGK
jgi:hypothetical protein